MSDSEPVLPRTKPAPSVAHAAPAEEIVVFISHREGKCAECGEELVRGSWIKLEQDRPFCLACADLAHLEFLPRGDAAMTRRASKHSPLRAVVVEWSRSRQRYERQGILVTPTAVRQAETECLADADVRARQRVREAERRAAAEPAFVATIAAAIRAQFPGCPADEATRIAEWTCEKHSGRVGRSAAAKELDQSALRLAVVAHIRHEHTRYDTLLMRHGDRQLARAEIAPEIDRVLRQWQMGLSAAAP